MLAVCIAIFLFLATVLFCLDLRQASETDWRRSFRRTGSYVLLLVLSVAIPLLHFYKLDPLVRADTLEVRGQYFPLNKSIQISADSSSADYYSQGLLSSDEVDAVQANPSIEFSRYDDKAQTLQAIARGMVRPLALKDQVLNFRPLTSNSQIIINSVPVGFSTGWFSTKLTVAGAAQKIRLPGEGETVSFSSLLCQAGIGEADQLNRFFATTPQTTSAATTNQLDYLWVVGTTGGRVGLVNGSAIPIKIDGNDLPSETRFTITSGDKLTYGVGRRAVTLTVQIEPARNRIYIIPDKPQTYPLYRPTSQPANSETEVFITSGITSPSPAYQLNLGERNVNLVKAALRYSLTQPASVKNSESDQEQAKKQELLRQGYIINNGIEERSYAFNEQATIGTDEGGVLIGIAIKQKTLLLTCGRVVLGGLIAGVMFGFWGGIQKRNYLFVLLPLVHLILGIRLILSYRGFALPPHMGDSYDKALLAFVFIPFAIFVWLHPRALSQLFDFSSYPDSYRRIFSSHWFSVIKTSLIDLVRSPAFVYLLILLIFTWAAGPTSNFYESLFLPIVFFIASLFLMRFLAARYQPGNPLLTWLRERSGIDVICLFAIPLLVAIFLKVFWGGAERLPGVNLRSEVLYAPLLLLASCRFYSWFFRNFLELGRSIRWHDYIWLFLPPLAYPLLSFIVGDFGFLIYSIPVFFLALIVTWRAGRKTSYIVFACSLIVLFVMLWTPLFTRSMPAFLKDTAIEYRFLAYQDVGWLEDVALRSGEEKPGLWQRIRVAIGWTRPPNICETGNTRARRILGVHEHFWTMFHFAARGTNGEGYGRSPIERVPFANGIAQSDNVYSLYVLSEHGGFGGIAVISIYVLLIFLLIFILTRHFASDLFPTLLLGGVAMTVLFAALYHAAGNVGAVPFTGRNLPLLSLNSNSDIVLMAILLSLAFAVIGGEMDLPGNNQGIVSSFQGTGNALNKWLAVIAVFFVGLYGFVIVKSWTAARDQLHRGDYDLAQFVEQAKDYIRDNVIALDPQTQKIGPVTSWGAGLGTQQYFRLLIDQFNLASPQDKANGRYFFMVRDLNLEEDLYGSSQPGSQTRKTILSVDENYFRHPSPFASKVFWHGGLRSSDSVDDQDYLSGEGLLLIPRHQLDLDDPFPGTNYEREVKTLPVQNQSGVTQATSRRFKVSNEAGSHLFDLYSMEADTVLEPHASGLFVNGQECKNKTRLEPGDILAINEIGRRQRTLTFFYQKDTSALLAGYRWINGREGYVYPQGASFSLARPIAEAVNSHISQLNQKNPTAVQDLISRQLTLSIDAELNSQLYEALEKEALGQNRNGLWDEINQRQGLAPRISATVMVPESGEVLALASWPSHNPAPQSPEQDKNNPRAYGNLMRRRDPEARLYLLNHNLERHVLGSATKPFIAGAAATAFPELLTLAVADNKSEYDRVFGIPTRPSWRGNGSGKVAFSNFLTHSNNLFEVMIGFLGLAETDANSRMRFTTIPVADDYEINGRPYAVQPDFTDTFNSQNGDALNLDKTHLAVKLKELFDVQVSGPDQTRDVDVWNKAVEMNLLPDQGNSFNLIAPETSNLALNQIRDARSFVGITLGGNTNRWNNVKSAEAFARLITGRQVAASFVKLDQKPEFPPLNDFSRVRTALLAALEDVVMNGTASKLNSRVGQLDSNGQATVGRRFAIFAKTGTLEGQFKSGRNDSNIILAAGMWNDSTQTLTDGVVISIYIEKGNLKGDSGRATELAGRILDILNERFKWFKGSGK
jgi:hypothetical protein